MSLNDVAELYTYMIYKVVDKVWLSQQRRAHTKMIDLYHSALLTEDQKHITLEFRKENSNLRGDSHCDFWLGRGRQIYNALGPSKSLLQYF